ncbi:metalloendoproteinase 3-MMP-like [Hevea brasiliensis]|uniref:metalloendoproteinase 3-MMP-like n=1 Tax=Hevea brasiliensis TaxID=3981 RepID=UPI0025FC24A4|nr:metalloendoproteinase 3-MMP-like [Hevea brasiliensis]
MASKAFPIFSFTLIVFISLFPHAALANSNNEKSSPFDFLKHLQGCHKGDKLKGIHELKTYLEHFGYLNYKNQSQANNDDFDDLLESALKTYQLNYHLKVTGTLDSQTVSKMMMPRCGVPDIINGTTRMTSGKKNQRHSSTSFHTVSHYTFFPGSPKWPPSKYSLTYGFLPQTPSRAMDPVARAFQTWAANTHFRFARVQDYTTADIKIGFYRGNHGDGSSFDGRGGILAHAFAPQDGRFHYDADETWAVGATPGAIDLETVALHEIGHLLGLGHSSVEGAIMFARIPPGSTKGLHSDDIQGIRALYKICSYNGSYWQMGRYKRCSSVASSQL